MERITFTEWEKKYQKWILDVKKEAIKKFPSLKQDIIQSGDVCENGSIYLGNMHYLTGFTRWADSQYFCY